MTNWVVKTTVGDLFHKFAEDDDLKAFQTAMVERLGKLATRPELGADVVEQLTEELLPDLADAGTLAEVEAAVHAVYDWADWNAVWLDPGKVYEGA